MREIKFRAWDKIRKKMYDSVFYSYDRKTGIMNLDTDLGVIHFSERQAFELIQYTGLKDKNDKEIYEGDICKIKVNNNKEIIEEIKWKEYRWYPFGEGVPPNYTGTEIEVIRNIYENKELLEGKE